MKHIPVRAIALLLSSVLIGGFVPYIVAQQQGCPASQIFRMNLVTPPASLSSLTAVGNTPFSVISLKDDSSFPTPKPDGSLYLDTAFDTVSSNSNYTVWTFKVRPGLTWSDGRPASSADIAATYGPNFAFNATYDFPNAAAQVASAHVVDSSTYEFDLNAPNAHWPEYLGYLYFTAMYPAVSINVQGAGGNMFGSPAVGPFYDANYTPGSFQMTLDRNPYYTPQPAICQIQITFVDSLSLNSNYLQSGRTDLATVEPSTVSSVLQSNPHLQLYPGTGLAIQALQWNDTNYPYNMTEFRQAIAYGINQSDIIAHANAGYGIPAYSAEGLVTPVATGLYNPNQMAYRYDPAESVKLLQSIGITKGSDGFMHYKDGTIVHLHLWTDTDQNPDTVAAGQVESDLQQLGFTVDLFTTNVAGLSSNYFNGLHDASSAMILYTSYAGAFGSPFLDVLPGWDTLYVVTAPASTWEWPASAQAEYMNNYTAFLNTNDPTLEKQYVSNIQSINAQYLPMLPLAYTSYMWMANTQNWGNWPNPQTSFVEWGPSQMNRTLLDTLTPVSPSTTTSAAAGGSSPLIYVAGAIVVILVAAAAVLVKRRKPPQ